MENFVPAVCGSDESNLSTTQENDPSVYARFLEHAANGRLAASPETGRFRIGVSQDHDLPATGTGISYGLDHSDHVTLDYQPLQISKTGFTDSIDNTANGKPSSQRTGSQLPHVDVADPQTPAQPKLILGRPGTIMGLSQMFAVTQPSPGSRERGALLPSSSKPSPDIFNLQQLPKDAFSSPLVRPGRPLLSQTAIDLALSSSPVHSSSGPVVNPIRPAQQHVPESLNEYIPRRESQERRRHFAPALENNGETSDDDFLEAGAEITRRVKLERRKAARELAAVGTSRLNSSANNPVEVPSTNNHRRRSLADDYKAQCSGFDARDSQPDDIIADSQSPLDQREKHNLDDETHLDVHESHLDPKRSGHVHFSQEPHSSSSKALGSEFSEKLPGLDQTENSIATDSERDTSEPPTSQPPTFPLSEVSSNIPDLRTPAVQKKIHYPDGDIRVPETSPTEPHIQRYGEIISQTSPILSAGGLEDSFNPLTQDDEFNRVLKSPTPQVRTHPTKTKRSKATRKLASEHNFDHNKSARVIETAESKLVEGSIQDPIASGTEPRLACLRDTSEYVTAPTSLGTPNFEEKADPYAAYAASPPGNAAEQSVVEQAAVRSQLASTRGVRIPIENSGALPTSGSLWHEARLSANEGGSAITTPDKISTPQMKATTGILPESKNDAASRPAERLAAQISNEAVTLTVPQPSPDPSKIIDRGLRPASQPRGSARSLRRLVGNGIVTPGAATFHDETPPKRSRESSRSSRQASVISAEQIVGNEPHEPMSATTSARRKSTQASLMEPLLFSGMAFCVSYVGHDGEKKSVLRLIEQNGGRVLDQGFDELFDMSAVELASATRGFESKDNTKSPGLTLTHEARTIGFACLIADEHSRKAKFMQALALGLPCISGRWIEHCVDKGKILDWDSYLLPAGESSFLGGAVRNRNLQPYSAVTSRFSESFDRRPRMLTGKAILLVMSKGRVEERKKAYVFLTRALAASRVKRVHNNAEARKVLLEAEAEGEEWDWVYVDDNEKDANKTIFGQSSTLRKRKRGSTAHEEAEEQVQAPKRVKIISDEYVIQSLILGKLLEEA